MARKKYTEFEQQLMNDIAVNLKRVLKLRGVLQTELSEKTGLPTSTISDYVNANTLMSPGNLQKISDALNVSKADIDTSLKDISGEPIYKNIPLIGTICAGDGLLADQNIEDYIHYPFANKRQPDYALRVKGNSMIGIGIEDGDIVYMRYAQWAEHNGQIVAALINNEENATLKRMKWSDESPKIELVPENPDYNTIQVSPNEVKVCGVYMGHFKSEE